MIELRLTAARNLDYYEFLYFMGYRGGMYANTNSSDNRLDYFNQLKLSKECHGFWLERKDAWLPRGFIFLGHWELHFQKLGKLFRQYLRIDTKPIFEAHSLEEQTELFNRYWPKFKFHAFTRIFASEFVFNRFLYKGHFSGSSEHRTELRPPWKFIEDEFIRIFTTTLVRKNYFMQILFLGGILYEEGLPLEAQPNIFSAIKLANTTCHFLKSDLVPVLQSKPYDFISLSDTISYLPNEQAIKILSILHPQVPAGGTVVVRSFLRSPKIDIPGNWQALQDKNKWACELDATAVYQFHIFCKQ